MGFKTEQFVGKVDESLKCSICLDVLKDPWQCGDSHTFCKDCITLCLEEKQICPVGNNPLQFNSLVRNLGVKNVVEDLQVYCHPPKSDGQAAAKIDAEESQLKCDWTGKLQSLAIHRETCAFQQVQCHNVGCNTNMQRRELVDHDKICEYKEVECQKCGEVLVQLRLPVHKNDECPKEVLPCQNRSPETGQISKIKRKHLADHMRDDCVKTIVDCPYKDQGCSVQVERQHVDKHVQDNMAAHMMLLDKENKQLKEDLRQVKKELNQVKEELKRVKRRNVDKENISRGPGGNGYRTWWRGSGDRSGPASGPSTTTEEPKGNRFFPLGGKGRRGPGASSKRPTGRCPTTEREKALEAVRSSRAITKLSRSENRWVRPGEALKQLSEEEKKNIEIIRKFRGILNKLTPQTFSTLIQQVLDLEIDTPERLEEVINIIFEKAISEPSFSVAYANMCRYLVPTNVKVETKDGNDTTLTFRKILLNKCQKEFEKEKSDEISIHKKMDDLLQQGLSEEKLKTKKEELVLEEQKGRRRTLGNIRFIGELFKLKMLTESIMHDCIIKLLKSNDEESYECVSGLLSTIGKDLDHQRAKPRMDQYFEQLNKIIESEKTSSRCRFMLQDVCELRLNNWVPRRDDNNPKTIYQIHKEAAEEERRIMSVIKQSTGREPASKELIEAIEAKAVGIVDEYHYSKQLKKAIQCVKDLHFPRMHYKLVYAAFNHSLEKRSSERVLTAKLMHALLRNRVISKESYIKGLEEILKFAEDLEIDIPHIWKYLGEMTGTTIIDNVLSLTSLNKSIEKLVPTKQKAAKLMAEILISARSRTDPTVIDQLWTQSGLSFSNFFSSKEEELQFLKNNNLESLASGCSSTSSTQPRASKVQEELRNLILVKKSTNEDVFKWIDDNVKDPKDPKFIRTLVAVVCEGCKKDVDGSCDIMVFKQRSPLLQKYIDNNRSMELQALFSLQALSVSLDHPPGFLKSFFNALFDEEVISEDAFFDWEKDDSQNESQGKGTAKSSTVHFFEWLRSAEEEKPEES